MFRVCWVPSVDHCNNIDSLVSLSTKKHKHIQKLRVSLQADYMWLRGSCVMSATYMHKNVNMKKEPALISKDREAILTKQNGK